MDSQADIGIIGAGPIGIEMAIALKIAGISYLQFDKGQAGQMVSNFPAFTHFFSSSERIGIAGIPIQTIDQQKCSREEYLSYLRTVILQFGLKINAYEDVVHIENHGTTGFRIHTHSLKGPRQYQVKFLILATGGTSHPKRLHVPGENLPHVSIKMEDPHRYFQRRVVIIGGKNSAAESSLRCYLVGAKVTMAVRHEQFNDKEVKYWILPELLGRIEHKEIDCHYGVEVVEILPDAVKLRKINSHHEFSVPCDFVIKAIGFDADMTLFHSLGINLSTSHQQPEFDDATMETNIPNIYALGTATGGTQKKYRVFIENCHVHVEKIFNALCKKMHKTAVYPFPSWNIAKKTPTDQLEQ